MEGKRRKVSESNGNCVLSKEFIKSINGDSPSIKRRIEEESNINKDYIEKTTSFFTLSGVCVPRDIILYGIFEYLEFNYDMLTTIGSVNSSFYILILSNWGGIVKVNRQNIHQISLLILKSTDSFILGKDLRKSEFDYFLFNTDILRIKKIYFSTYKEMKGFFSEVEKRNMIFPVCQLIGKRLSNTCYPQNTHNLFDIPETCFPKLECLVNPPGYHNLLKSGIQKKIKKLVIGLQYAHLFPNELMELNLTNLKSLKIRINSKENICSNFQILGRKIKNLQELQIESRFECLGRRRRSLNIWKNLSEDIMKSFLLRNPHLQTLSIHTYGEISVKYGNEVFSTHRNITKLSLIEPTFPAVESAINCLPNLRDLELFWNFTDSFATGWDRFDHHDFFVRIFDHLIVKSKIPNWKIIVEKRYSIRDVSMSEGIGNLLPRLSIEVKNGNFFRYIDIWNNCHKQKIVVGGRGVGHHLCTWKDYIKTKLYEVFSSEDKDHPYRILEMKLSEWNYNQFQKIGSLEEKMILKEQYKYKFDGIDLVSEVYHKKKNY